MNMTENKIVANNGSSIVLYTTDDGNTQLEVKLEKDTVWLNREQIAQLYGRDYKTIAKHINNALREELEGEPVVAKFATPKKYGRKEGYTQMQKIDYYNLDMIISVDESFRAGETAHNVEVIHKDSAGNADSSKGTVMIVDDSALIRKMLRAMLEKNGYAVTAEACNGEEAVQKYKENKADVVTLDITMPNMDGIECLEKIMDYDPDANVIMITAAGQQNKVIKALKEGAKKFITKPYNVEDVLKNIGDMVE